MTNELAKPNKGVGALATLDMTTEALANHMVKSGFFANINDVSKAIMKIQFGKELGIPPMASMSGVHLIQGKPVLSSQLLATTVQRSGVYRHKVKELTNDRCSIEFYRGNELLGVSTFTIQDAVKAKLAGKDIWQQYPRNMLFARAMSNGVRWYCPEVTGGPVYTTEEMTDAGEKIDDPNPEPKAPGRRTVANDALDVFNKQLEGNETTRGAPGGPAGESAPADNIIDEPEDPPVGALTDDEVLDWREGASQVAMTHGWTEDELRVFIAAGLKKRMFANLATSTPDFRDNLIHLLRDDAQQAARDARRKNAPA
jgi:hypothetical protein